MRGSKFEMPQAPRRSDAGKGSSLPQKRFTPPRLAESCDRSYRLSFCHAFCLSQDNSLSVRLSVRDVPVLDENGLTYCHRFFHDMVAAQSFQFYQHQTSSRNSDGITTYGGAKYRRGIKISRFSTNRSLYLADDTIYRHSYCGRRIGTRMRSIKRCHFQ